MTPAETFATAALPLFVLFAVAAVLARPVLRVLHRQFDLMLDGQRESFVGDER